MIQYLRIPKNKFWGWVFSSLAIGLLLGAGAAWVLGRTSSAKQIDDLKQQLASATTQAASSSSQLQARLDSADASVTALTDQVTALQAQVTSSKKTTTSSSSSSTSSSGTVTLEVLSRKISPSNIATGDYITMTAQVQGSVTKVTMRITSTSTGDSTTYSLKKSSSDGDTSTWKRTVRGPKTKGTFRYYATAYDKNGNSATMPGAKASSFTVE